MRDLYVSELTERYGDRWEDIDWDASGEALSRMLTERLGTRCRVLFDTCQIEDGVVVTRIDTREFGADPASPVVDDVFDSFVWIRFRTSSRSG